MHPANDRSTSAMWSFRPHHLMCWQTYRGKGYSEPFVANFDGLQAAYEKDAAIQIVLGIRADAICVPCPHRREESCHFAASVDGRDQALLAGTGYQAAQVMSLQEALAFVASRFLKLQHTVCQGCEWQSFCRDTHLETVRLAAKGNRRSPGP